MFASLADEMEDIVRIERLVSRVSVAMCPRFASVAAALILVLVTASEARAVPVISQLTPSLSPPQPVGTPIIWTAAATDAAAGQLVYRFSVRPPGGVFTVLKDYSSKVTYEWAPAEREGIYEVLVTVRNRSTNATAQMVASYTISSRVTGSSAVVSPTRHPLVALYSSPPCPAGSTIRVRFQQEGATTWQSTPLKNCIAGVSANFYIAGMYASTNYVMRHDVFSGPLVRSGPALSFRTGALGIPAPVVRVLNPADPPHSLDYPILFRSAANYIATDLSGRVVWYFNKTPTSLWRPVPGGTFLGSDAPDVVREVDLAGYMVRETNLNAVNDKLGALGYQKITSFHHDVIRLPDGRTAFLARVERILTDVQGPGPIDIVGDAVVVLDRNLEVVWYWNGFDHLDVRRKAILDEKCAGGCVVVNAPSGNDWTHSNSISYTADGHLLISMRHQDWVIKVNYANGAGNGNVIWRLGKDGDFRINSADPYPWNSHQHDAEFELGGTQILSLFDNGNTRRMFYPGANSRGQAYRLDESTMTATLILNADLHSYSDRIGSAQRLPSGSYSFDSGAIGSTAISQTSEVSPAGEITYLVETTSASEYRTFRMQDMYTP